ncbi:hypothetical protein FHS95_000792 [Sphingomonas naasensis]|uniref:Uncharacterized protein n=1 Tax=Sphingomonas naasensis TaxID=1344951 RepID=A0A4S1WXG4_9SPHN|nr:hypothetical protein [Sphingomonas naasensis]NIJ19123.1 hypothetical protein [Sphingomonas naasensis]TGX46316.1 hypothetical protein E5A74_03955 [Sphingomonas naasensis]
MDARQQLDDELASILDGGLGLAVFPRVVLARWEALRPDAVRTSAIWRGGQIFAGYLVFFCAVPWLAGLLLPGFVPSRPLLALQIYGAFWAGWSTITATLASDAVLRILRRDVLPRLSETACAAIREELRLRYRPGALRLQSWIIAIAAAGLAGLLVRRPDLPLPELVWWCCGWAILFATAAKVVATATFYRLFPPWLVDALGTRLWLDPARSELVEAIARIGRIILLFWVGIAFSIALILPAGIDWTRPQALLLDPTTKWFVTVEVPLTGFFSIGVGVLIFLAAESALRRAAQTLQLRALERIDAEAGARIARIDTLTTDDLKQVAELRALHASLAAGGSYRSLFVSALSVLLPFVPLFTLLVTMLR